MLTRDQLTAEESDLSVNFYDVACDYARENFGQIVHRVMGANGFARYPHAEAFEAECRAMFKLARVKP